MLRLVIASKYASLTHEEYYNFMTCEDPVLTLEYQKNLQLVTGWLSVDIGFCSHEANLSLSRMGSYQIMMKIHHHHVFKYHVVIY